MQVPEKITPGPPKSSCPGSRLIYAAAFAAGVLAFVGGALLSVRVGDSSLGASIIVAALLSALALIWTVRLS